MEPSDYTFFNVGDMAMLQVAISRLSTLLPDARIQVFTDDAEALYRYCPEADPLSRAGREEWLSDGYLFGPLYRYAFDAMKQRQQRLERYLRRSRPGVARTFMQLRLKVLGKSTERFDSFLSAVSNADLFVVAGMGGITDCFEDYAIDLLDTVELAIQAGVPTALLGQGIGPIQNRELMARAKSVLPFVDFIGLREGRAGKPLVTSLGVSPDRILVTGDDAIQVAYSARAAELGDGLGVNARIGWYSRVDERLLAVLRPALQEAAARYGAPMVPVPISRTPGEDDLLTIRELTRGYPSTLRGGQGLDNPKAVIEEMRKCRVVVAGSYHAAVFALAQGIPVVGLVNSPYYANKMLGIADQFAPGCEVVCLNDPMLQISLASAIDRAWTSADDLRSELLEAARRQVDLSWQAYGRASGLAMPSKTVERDLVIEESSL